MRRRRFAQFLWRRSTGPRGREAHGDSMMVMTSGLLLYGSGDVRLAATRCGCCRFGVDAGNREIDGGLGVERCGVMAGHDGAVAVMREEARAASRR
jgi:hypothetical protein